MRVNGISGYNINKVNDRYINDSENIKSDFSFENYLKNALDKVNKMQTESDKLNTLLATGNVDNLHEVIIATEKARISLQLTMSIRNKIIDSYQEIMRMQI